MIQVWPKFWTEDKTRTFAGKKRQTDKQTNGLIVKQKYRQAYIIYKYKEIDKQTDKQKEEKTDRERFKQTDIQTNPGTNLYANRQVYKR